MAKVATGNKGGLGGQCDGLMHLLAHQAMIIMMIMISRLLMRLTKNMKKGLAFDS